MNERTVTLYRISQRRTDDSKVRRQIEEIVQRGLAGYADVPKEPPHAPK